MKYRILKLATGRICALALSLCVVFLLLCLSGGVSVQKTADVEAANGVYAIGEGEDAVKAFLEGFGWQVADEPATVKEIFIPKSFDEVYDRYNEEIQIPQGCDLRRYAGLKATLFCFEVLNYPDEDAVFANVLVHENIVIGGDICSSRLDGFMHGFSMQNAKCKMQNDG